MKDMNRDFIARKSASRAPTIALLLAASTLAGCGAFSSTLDELKDADTVGAEQQGPTYSYRPLDPLKALLWHPPEVPVTNCRILELLPDETMRFAVGQLDVSGNVSYGVATAGTEGHRYVVVLDYIKSDTFAIPSTTSPGSSVPTYVGVGLRLSANLFVRKGNVDLGNLIAIGAAAQANQLTGTLVIQTLGISGKSVALPVPSEISVSSIQNALVAIGTIKGKIYDADTAISPRVVGTYDVFGKDTAAFDQYFASILASPPELRQRVNSPCTE